MCQVSIWLPISRRLSVSSLLVWNVLEYSILSLDFMHEALLDGGVILIHCMAGISRSTTVTCVYLMTATTLSMNDVMKALKLKRDVVNPNQGFVKQMREYEREKLPKERIRLAEKFPNSAVLQKRLETEIRAILAE